jgi:hypothetical protein
MSEVYRVSDVDEAIDLASRFRDEKRYDWFRGQVRSDWLPHTSLMRLQLRDPAAWDNTYKSRFVRFYHWLENTPGLTALSKDVDSVFAIAQHYGLPTHYLDFTTDPAVAGFFAADTDSPEPGQESCILCLDSADLLSLWDTLRNALGPEDGPLADIELVRPNVANLWRLQAQAGVFLYAPTNWEVHYPMDRIVFPYSGYPAFPTKRDVYPDRKSQLEILLDQFFDNEKKLENTIWMRELFDQIRETNPNVFWAEASDQPLGYLPEYLKSGRIEMHASWQAATVWLTLVEETHSDVWRRDVPIKLDFAAAPAELSSRFANGARRAMERDGSLRKHSITWKLDTTTDLTLRPALATGLATLWDGLRSLPFTDAEIAQALGNWVALYKMNFDLQWDPSAESRVCSQLSGPSIRIEFGAPDGSSAIGYAAISDLQAALRPDLSELLSDEHKDRAGDLEFLLQIIKSPQLLFNFAHLAHLFAIQVAPSQMKRSAPFFFHLARLKVLGLP